MLTDPIETKMSELKQEKIIICAFTHPNRLGHCNEIQESNPISAHGNIDEFDNARLMISSDKGTRYAY